MNHLCDKMLTGVKITYNKFGYAVLRIKGPGIPRVHVVVNHCPWCGLSL